MARISEDSFTSDIGPDRRCRETGNLTLSLGSMKLRCEFGIRRTGDQKSAGAPMETRPGIRRRLLFMLRSGTPRNSRKSDSNLQGTPRQDHADCRDERYPNGRNIPGVIFWSGLNPAEREEFHTRAFSRMVAWDDISDRLAVQETAADPFHDRRSAVIPEQRTQSLNGENCTVILSDVTGFGARTRTDADRRIIREALFSITYRMLRGIPGGWSCDDRGDGLLTVIPPSISTARVINQLHRELPAALDEYNRTIHDSARIQLRIAINVGPVATDSMGVSGEAIIITARLIEAPRFKEAIRASEASLGLIASTFIYETVIRHDRGLTGYSTVEVDVKETNVIGWIKLFETMASASGGSGLAEAE